MSVIWLLALMLGAGPPTREVSRYESGRVAYTVVQTPGVGAAGQMLELTVRLEELFKIADPSFGKHRLLTGASFIAYLVGPRGDVVDARLAMPDGDDGNFAVHFTPERDGIYAVHIAGTAPDGIVLTHAVLVSVNVWPMLADLRPDPLPRKLPLPALGDLTHGKLVCARDCKRQPSALTSEAAEASTDEALLTALAPSASALRPVDRADLLAYLRAQFVRVRDLFPSAATYVVERRGLDSDAVARIKVLSGQTPAEHDGLVFVVYGGEQSARIEPTSRVAQRRLQPSARVGYVVYDGDLAIALGRKPGLKLLGARMRSSDGGSKSVTVRANSPSAHRAIELVSNLVTEEHERAEIDTRAAIP